MGAGTESKSSKVKKPAKTDAKVKELAKKAKESAKADKKVDKKKNKADKKQLLAKVASVPVSAKDIIAKAAKKVKNVAEAPKAKTKVKKPASSEDDSDDESDDEKPTNGKVKKLASSEEDSSEDESEGKKPATRVDGKGKKAASSSSSDSSEDESEDEKPKAVQVKATKNAPSSSESDHSESSSEDEAPSKAPQKATSSKSAKQAASSSDSSSSSEEEKKVAKTSKTSVTAAKKALSSSSEDSGEDSDEDNGESGGEEILGKTAKASESSDSDSDNSSTDDVEMASPQVQEVKGNKRKAEGDASTTFKKVKLADGDAGATDDSVEECKSIFVGSLSWDVDNDRLAQEFAECGEVVSATVQVDRNTGRSRGFGYVHFTTTEAVKAALLMNGKEIDGRAVNIDKSLPRNPNTARDNRAKTFGDKQSPPSTVLFVGNLSFNVGEDQLWEAFGEHGDIKSVRVPTDRDSGRPKGFAYVEFSDIDSAKKACEAMSGQELDGRSLRLDFSQPRDNSGGGGRGGFGGGRGGGRGGFGDRGRGGRGGRGGFGDHGGRGGRGVPRGRGGARNGSIATFEGKKIKF